APPPPPPHPQRATANRQPTTDNRMTVLERKSGSALRRLGMGARGIVAVSGGADSIALLDALARRGEPGAIVVAHLNHQLRGAESDEDEDFVRRVAAERGLAVYCERAPVAAFAEAEGMNLEAAARRFRYDFFARLAERLDIGMVFTGHTRDDQAETILMRLLRGAGAQGLRGIRERRGLGARTVLLRPLLDVSRAEVLDHCAFYGLQYRTDSSNLSPDFTRNRVRLELLPLLRSFNPRADESLARASALLHDDDDALRLIAEALLERASDANELRVQELQDAPPAVRRRALRAWLARAAPGLQRADASHLAALERMITSGQSGRVIQLPGHGRVFREFDRLRYAPADLSPVPPPEPVALTANDTPTFGAFSFRLLRRVPRCNIPPDSPQIHAILRESNDLDTLQLRARIAGDAYVPAGARHRIKLKTLLIRHKIPLSQRDTYPLVVTADDRIVWAPGLPVAAPFAPRAQDEELALVIAHRQRTD
ncbi:MAG: tRNA lysidine(34) synthetase TilS, partial [Blastocatellia bacterium]|nr:tRNA lysidine(34) synthetase TilS [Blastocatellia bacterium]